MNAASKQEISRSGNTRGSVRRSKPGRRKRETSSHEKRVLELLKKGDQEAIREIIHRYHDKLFSVANRICNNPADAEEILQHYYPGSAIVSLY